MPRRQMYDDVLDVALRQTLIDHGFTRKTKRDYMQERPDFIWYFEVEMEPRLGIGFRATAAVSVPEVDAILRRNGLDDFMFHGITHNRTTVVTTLLRLIEIADGRHYRHHSQPVYPPNGLESRRGEPGIPIVFYLENQFWTVPRYTDALGRSDEECKSDWDRGVRELGEFMDRQWLIHAPDWYRKCDDPMFIVDWMETEDSLGRYGDITLAALCHVAGSTDRARFYLRRRVEEAKITYEELYRELHKDKRGNWLRRLWSSGWSEEKIVESAKGRLEGLRETADAARKLADGIGIRLD
jgi:hypothetical protein